MDFVRKLIIIIEHWSDTETSPYAALLDAQSEELVELVIGRAARAAEIARTTRKKTMAPPREADFIAALIDKLQDAGY